MGVTQQYRPGPQTYNMYRLLFLTAVASALPQFPGYGYYNPQPFQQREYPLDEATARYLINFGVFQRVTGTFKTMTAAEVTAANGDTVAGDVAWYQNPFTGDNSKYRITLKDLAADTDYVVMLQTDCAKATSTGATVMTGTAPSFQLFDRFTKRGTIPPHNIDGDDSKTKVTDNYLVVRMSSSTGDVIGCTSARLS